MKELDYYPFGEHYYRAPSPSPLNGERAGVRGEKVRGDEIIESSALTTFTHPPK
jgi:hypothetical protein